MGHTWQITRQLIVIKSFFKDSSVILLNMISSKGTFQNFQPEILLKHFRTYLKIFFREPLKIWLTKYEPFKDIFRDRDRKFTQSISRTHIFTQSISRTHIFITQSLLNERLSVTGYSLQTLLITFWRKNLRIHVLANNPWTVFLLMMKL